MLSCIAARSRLWPRGRLGGREGGEGELAPARPERVLGGSSAGLAVI